MFSRSLKVGSLYYSELSSPIIKIDWHPWGLYGSTLLVMTADGTLRYFQSRFNIYQCTTFFSEYDVTISSEKPQQTMFFGQRRRRGSIVPEDDRANDVVSFIMGNGKADWGPLTVYALMRSGDIYSICPYMPKNA